MEDAHKLFKIPKSEGPDIWIRLPRHKWPKSWSSMEDPIVLLNKVCMVIFWQDFYGKGNLRKSFLKHGWEKFQLGMFVHREKGLFLSVYVDDIKLTGKRNRILIRCGKYLTKK